MSIAPPPQSLRKQIVGPLLVVVGLFVVAAVLGANAPPKTSSAMMGMLVERLAPLENDNPFLQAGFIFLNNTFATAVSFLLGVLLGLPTALFVLTNGYVLGIVITRIGGQEGFATLAAGILPHGVLELPLILFAAALGILLGQESWRRLTSDQNDLRATFRRSLNVYVRWVVPGLFLAAAIETFLTPHLLKAFSGS